MRTARSFALLLLCGCVACAHEGSRSGPPLSSRSVLEEFASILNKNIPEFRKIADPRAFYVVNGRPVNFSVFNLADTTNAFPPRPLESSARADPDTNPFVLNQRGVYHFAPLDLNFSFSHIAILDNGRLKVFSFLNCEGRGETVRDVLQYLAQMGSYSDTVIARVQNYRSYGTYYQTDPQSHVTCQ
jgi:hypothetical protein